MTTYSEGLLGNGATILEDGRSMSVSEVVSRLNVQSSEIERLRTALDSHAAEIERLRSALDCIAEKTGSDDPCRPLVQIARDVLRYRLA